MLSTRQQEILTLVKSRKRVGVDDLALAYQTTPQTIRKDLQALADAHLIVRFHGGAAALGGTEYTGFDARRDVARAEKIAIAQAVARRIPDHCTIFINTGTTTEHLAETLSGHAGLKILTDNVDMASKLRKIAGLEAIIPGGRIRGSDGAILGIEAVRFVERFRVDFAIVGAAAIDPSGDLLDYDMDEAEICRSAISHASHVILAADAAKFERKAPVCIGHISQMHALVSDGPQIPGLATLCLDHDVEYDIATIRR